MRSAVPQLFQAARTHTSLTEGVREIQAKAAGQQQTGPVFMGIAGGVGQLPLAVAASVRARGGEFPTGTPARELRREAAGGWRITAGERVLHADAVIVAVPAPAAAGLLRAESPAAAAELSAVEYASMALVSLAYRRADLEPARGQRFPRAARRRPHHQGRHLRLPEVGLDRRGGPGRVVLRTSVGRYGETEVLGRDDADLVEISRHDLGGGHRPGRRTAGDPGHPLDRRLAPVPGGAPRARGPRP